MDWIGDQKSKEGIKNAAQGLFDKFMLKVDLQPEEVEVQNDFAYAIGTVDGVLTPRAEGDPNTIKFRIFWLLRKEAAGWKGTFEEGLVEYHREWMDTCCPSCHGLKAQITVKISKYH